MKTNKSPSVETISSGNPPTGTYFPTNSTKPNISKPLVRENPTNHTNYTTCPHLNCLVDHQGGVCRCNMAMFCQICKKNNQPTSSTKESPERIWLQWNTDPDEQSWCGDKINDDDVEYVKVSHSPKESPTVKDNSTKAIENWEKEFDKNWYSFDCFAIYGKDGSTLVVDNHKNHFGAMKNFISQVRTQAIEEERVRVRKEGEKTGYLKVKDCFEHQEKHTWNKANEVVNDLISLQK